MRVLFPVGIIEDSVKIQSLLADFPALHQVIAQSTGRIDQAEGL